MFNSELYICKTNADGSLGTSKADIAVNWARRMTALSTVVASPLYFKPFNAIQRSRITHKVQALGIILVPWREHGALLSATLTAKELTRHLDDADRMASEGTHGV